MSFKQWLRNAGPMTTGDDFFLPDLCRVQAIFFLVLVGELLAVVLTLVAGGLLPFDWTGFALISLFVQWVILLSAALLCQSRPWLRRLPLPQAAAISYLLVLAVAVTVSVAGQRLLPDTVFEPGQWQLDWNRLGRDVLVCAVLAGIVLRYFYLSQQLQNKQRATLQAQLQALQSRIRPHFLFNSMNSIASLIAIDPDAAETAVEDLAALFRASLAETASQQTLADELALCNCYARIEQLRLGSRLHIDWQLQAMPDQLPMPPLTLQPLLENAIYHGIQQCPEGGTVRVTGSLEGSGEAVLATFEVSNPLPVAPRRSQGNRMAQTNIHHRLQAIYGDRAGLFVREGEGRFVARIQYPVAGRFLSGDQS